MGTHESLGASRTLVYEVTLDQLMGLLAPLAATHKLNCIKRIREIIPEYGLKEVIKGRAYAK